MLDDLIVKLDDKYLGMVEKVTTSDREGAILYHRFHEELEDIYKKSVPQIYKNAFKNALEKHLDSKQYKFDFGGDIYGKKND